MILAVGLGGGAAPAAVAAFLPALGFCNQVTDMTTHVAGQSCTASAIACSQVRMAMPAMCRTLSSACQHVQACTLGLASKSVSLSEVSASDSAFAFFALPTCDQATCLNPFEALFIGIAGAGTRAAVTTDLWRHTFGRPLAVPFSSALRCCSLSLAASIQQPVSCCHKLSQALLLTLWDDYNSDDNGDYVGTRMSMSCAHCSTGLQCRSSCTDDHYWHAK